MKKSIVFMCASWLLSSIAVADVVMVDPMALYRADRVTAEWEADALTSIALDVVVTGRNESNQLVGFKELEWFITEEQWAEAVNEYFSLAPTVHAQNVIETSGVLHDVTEGLYMPWLDIACAECFAVEDMDTFIFDWNVLRVEQAVAWADYETGWFYQESGGGCHYYLYAVHGANNPDYFPGADATELAGPEEEYGQWQLTEGFDEGCNSPPVINSFMSVLDGQMLGTFLPVSEFSAARPSILPGLIGTFNQNERSEIALLVDGLDTVADQATDFYQTDAHAGYPGFALFFGYFAGTPDDPGDEGDCEEPFCDGGGGGGSGDLTSVVQAVNELRDLMAPVDGEFPDGAADYAENAGQELSLMDCIEEDGETCTADVTLLEGMGDVIGDYVPTGGACGVFDYTLHAEYNVVLSLDTCDIEPVRLIIEWLLAGATMATLFYIATTKEG